MRTLMRGQPVSTSGPFKGFVGWQGVRGSAGLEVFSRTNELAGDNGDDHVIAGVSAFGSLPLSAAFKGFGRVRCGLPRRRGY